MGTFFRRLFSAFGRSGPSPREWLAVEDRVADALVGTDGLAGAAPKILETIGKAFGWRYGVLFVPDASEARLKALATWAAPDANSEEFAEVMRSRPVARGERLAGKVWGARVPRHASDAATLSEADPSGAVGLGGAFAFPLVHGDECQGVVEFFDAKPIRLDPASSVAAAALGKHLGRFATRTRALRVLAAREADLSDLLANGPAGIVAADAEGRILLANRAELQTLGYHREEYVGRHVEDFHEDPETARELVRRLNRGEEVRGLLARVRSKDRGLRWVSIDANATFRDGRFVRSRLISRDVTAEREAEDLLARSERRFRTLVESVEDHAIAALDAEGRVTAWNAGAERALGWAAAEALGRDVEETFPTEDRQSGLPGRLVRIAADEGQVRHEGWRVRRNGSRFYAEAVYAALRDATGKLEEVVVLVRDLTERRHADDLRRRGEEIEAENRSMLRSQRGPEDALRGVSEAVRGPVNASIAAAERLRAAARAGRTPESADAEAVLAGAGMMRVALDRMTEISAGPSRPVRFRPRPVDPLRIATEVRDLLGAAATDRRIRIDVDVDPGLGGLVTDPDRLRQVVYNLLGNGVRASRERGRVVLRVAGEGPDQFRVEVEDSGIGISPETLKEAWRPRPPGIDETAPQNALAATQVVVEQQGGRVGARSTPGRGSTFFAVLPRVLESEGKEGGGGHDAPARRRVLVLTDDVATRAGLSWTFGNAGHEVVPATRSQDALDAIRARRCDIVAVDLLIKGTTAVEFAALLKHEAMDRRPACLLACVGAGAAGVAAAAVSDVLPRPAPTDRLLAALERFGVARGRTHPVLVVDSDLEVLRATTRAVEALGYRAVAEPDGDAALRSAADDVPTAVIVAPFVLGIDGFTFLRLLRSRPELRVVPVLFTVPAKPTEAEAEQLLEMAGGAPGRESGAAARVLVDAEAVCAATLRAR